MKNKSNLNFIIDVLMFIVMMAIGGIGFLMKFILVSGSERWGIYGENVDLFLWGWDRHQWGSLHLILGYILLGLLILHIVFHWKQIKSMFKNLINNRSLRVAFTFIFIIVSILFFLFAFVVDINVSSPQKGEGRNRVELSRPKIESLSVNKQEKNVSAISSTKPESEENRLIEHDEHQRDSSIKVYGSMTLRFVANKYNIPADSIKKYLGIPLSLSDNESLGQLRRRYDFHMSDVERFIAKYKQKH